MSVLTLRTDESVDQAIEYLQSITDESQSAVVRRAVLSAERQARRDAMRREALDLAGDSYDRAEAQAILADMAGSDAW